MRKLMMCALILIQSIVYAQTNSTVSFQLKDKKGKDVTNAEIRFLNHPYSGRYEKGVLIFENIPNGRYSVIITAEQFASKIENIEVKANMLVTSNLSSAETTLDDVVINADKKEGKFLNTATSATVLDAKAIRNMRIWELTNLSGISPNVTLSHSGDNRNVTAIRGIVTTSYEQAVATYIDGVAQFGLDTYLPQLNEIESIEILRGSQGTLFGRNAMGGVINITTRKPVNKTSLRLDLQTGSKGQQRYSAAFQQPLIKNKLFLGLNVLHDRRDGFYTNTFTDKAYDRQAQTMLGLQVRYLFDNNWSILADVKEYFAKNDGAFPLETNREALFSKPYQLAQNLTAAMRDKTANSSILIRHKGNKADFTLQSSRQRNYRYYENTLDADFSPADIVGIFNNYGNEFNTVNVFSNEAKLQSNSNSKLEWVTGIYQFIQESPTRQATAFGEDAGLFGVPDKNFAIISTNIAKNTGIAGYGNIKYSINDKWKLTAGLRLDNETRKMTVRSEYAKESLQSFVLRQDTTGKTRYSALSPKVAIQYNANERHISYLGYTRGFRSGGLTSIGSDPSQRPLSPFLPEYANSFEAGIKGENKSKTLYYGFAVFYNIVNDIQAPFLVLPDAVTVIKNGGRMVSKGGEVEITAKLIKGLTIQYNAGVTDAGYTELKSVSNGNTVDLKGKKQIFTPSSTHFIAIQYQRNIKNGEFTIRTEYNHIGKQYFDFANTIEQEGYGLTNMRASYRTKHFDFSIWGRNLMGIKYIDYAYDFGAAHLGNPKMIGVGLGYRL